ncbi:accessory gene regulator B family protein [Paenibacillus sp. FSL R7-0179]|uniref:accessory gene regulator B family protein n=1 Tax=Paenibacillus sp. FSL R7-0179 TaxID=2921672 RepID=UPI004040B1CD
MVHHKVIMQKELSIIQYGLKAMIETSIILSTMIIFSIFMGCFLEALAWVGTVFFIRSLGGGKHARTFLQCYFISVATFVFCMLSIHYFQHQFLLYKIIWGAALLMFVCSLVSLCIRARQEKAEKIGALINSFLLLAYSLLIFRHITNPILLASLLGLTVSQASSFWKGKPNHQCNSNYKISLESKS